MSRWVRCSYGKRAGFVDAKVVILFQTTKQLKEKHQLLLQYLTFNQKYQGFIVSFHASEATSIYIIVGSLRINKFGTIMLPRMHLGNN